MWRNVLQKCKLETELKTEFNVQSCVLYTFQLKFKIKIKYADISFSANSPDIRYASKSFDGSKSVSCDTSTPGVGEIGVKHIAVQMPLTSNNQYEGFVLILYYWIPIFY